MNIQEHQLIDNVIYTPPTTHEVDARGIGWYFYENLLKNKDRIAQIDGLTGDQDTYGDVLQRSIRAALWLKSIGVNYGDMISLCTNNHFNTCVPIISSMFIGAKFSAFHPSQTLSHTIHLFKIVMPKVVFVSTECVNQFEDVIRTVGASTIIVVFGTTRTHVPFFQVIQPSEKETIFRPVCAKNIKDTIVVFFSSGTSGFSKGICHTHFSILSAPPSLLRIGASSVCLTTDLPYWNIYTFLLYFAISNGVARMIYSAFDEDDPWKVFTRKVDSVILNTIHTVTIANTPKPESIDLSGLRNFITGGSGPSKYQVNKMNEVFSTALLEINYGQSEIFQTITCFDLENPKHVELLKIKPTSCGLPKPGILYTVVVVGVSHDIDDHHPMAFVQLKNGAVVDENDIVKYVEERVDDKHRLRGGVRFLKTFPLTPSNKVSRRELRQMVAK
ncbi:hypothetical protein FQR65_LT04866 [Abscondita terminalis]|nr:hypothetical protein FQR65_LT04866 [Abscondita terminalis]